ncbi:MAG: bifunctional homocysteine S-methyltransferase/methylenetetrahydrofolate reductase [Vicinamibacterales bacterium]|nr:bifunctional homocysteine S-methyltransferase/methylenetetrahydrofolate reductase [Vicinamibacterales bacterium]
MPTFLESLDQRVLVCDGAMGTMLYAKGIFVNRCFDALNLTEPDLVSGVHREYVRAGADVIETNTFGANRLKLRGFGLADKLREINVEGARLARSAARGQAFVAGAIGPLGVRIEPWGKTGVDEAEAFFREQVDALLEGGVDLFVLETFRDLSEMGAAIRAVRAACALPVVAQMTIEEDGNSLDGTPPEEFAPALEALGADVLGVNCSIGPAPMLETVERIAAVTKARLSAQPNAGRPRDIEGRNIYLTSPEYFASYARRFVGAGVRLVGGCCGTNPDHIRQIAGAVRALESSGGAKTARPSRGGAAHHDAGVPAIVVPPSEKSALGQALSAGRFATVVSLPLPKGFDYADTVEHARALKARGVNAVSVLGGPRGARMSPLALAVLLQQHAGVETVLEYSCRDRNLIGMQSDLLGAHAMAIRNVLLVTGDARSVGGYPDATTVFDVDSVGLTNVVGRLNHGHDIGGQSIGHATAFHVGVMVNPGAEILDAEVRRFAYKVEAGAEYAVTKPVFDVATVETFMKAIEAFRIPILVGLWPFDTVTNAEFMANEVPGVQVPAAVLDRMRRAAPEAAAAEGVAIAAEVGQGLRGLVQGVHLSGPAHALESTLRVLDRLG